MHSNANIIWWHLVKFFDNNNNDNNDNKTTSFDGSENDFDIWLFIEIFASFGMKVLVEVWIL